MPPFVSFSPFRPGSRYHPMKNGGSLLAKRQYGGPCFLQLERGTCSWFLDTKKSTEEALRSGLPHDPSRSPRPDAAPLLRKTICAQARMGPGAYFVLCRDRSPGWHGRDTAGNAALAHFPLYQRPGLPCGYRFSMDSLSSMTSPSSSHFPQPSKASSSSGYSPGETSMTSS